MMKVRITVLAAVVSAAVLLSACGKAEEKPPERLPEEFTVNAKIHDGELDAEAEFSRTPAGWSVIMTAPERLAGVSFELTDIECMASCGDLHYPMAAETMLGSSPLVMTTRALDGCVRGSDSGVVSGQTYRLTYADGVPAALEIGTVTVELGDIEYTPI